MPNEPGFRIVIRELCDCTYEVPGACETESREIVLKAIKEGWSGEMSTDIKSVPQVKPRIMSVQDLDPEVAVSEEEWRGLVNTT